VIKGECAIVIALPGNIALDAYLRTSRRTRRSDIVRIADNKVTVLPTSSTHHAHRSPRRKAVRAITELMKPNKTRPRRPQAMYPTSKMRMRIYATRCRRFMVLSYAGSPPVTLRNHRMQVWRMLGAGSVCRFAYSAGDAAVAAATAPGAGESRGVIKLHGRLVPMTVRYQTSAGDGFELSSDDVSVVAAPAEGPAGSGVRDAEAHLRIGNELEAGYGGFYECTR
jgi:hypothetical protein